MPLCRLSAAVLTSHARHGVRAVDGGCDSQKLMAQPCTPHLIPQAVQLFKIETCNGRDRGGRPLVFLSGDLKGDTLFEKRVSPFSSRHKCRSPLRTCAEKEREYPFCKRDTPLLRAIRMRSRQDARAGSSARSERGSRRRSAPRGSCSARRRRCRHIRPRWR